MSKSEDSRNEGQHQTGVANLQKHCTREWQKTALEGVIVYNGVEAFVPQGAVDLIQ